MWQRIFNRNLNMLCIIRLWILCKLSVLDTFSVIILTEEGNMLPHDCQQEVEVQVFHLILIVTKILDSFWLLDGWEFCFQPVSTDTILAGRVGGYFITVSHVNLLTRELKVYLSLLGGDKCPHSQLSLLLHSSSRKALYFSVGDGNSGSLTWSPLTPQDRASSLLIRDESSCSLLILHWYTMCLATVRWE